MSIQTVVAIRVERLIERIKQRDIMTYPGDDPKLGLPPIGFSASFLVPIFRDRVNDEFSDFYKDGKKIAASKLKASTKVSDLAKAIIVIGRFKGLDDYERTLTPVVEHELNRILSDMSNGRIKPGDLKMEHRTDDVMGVIAADTGTGIDELKEDLVQLLNKEFRRYLLRSISIGSLQRTLGFVRNEILFRALA